MKPSQWLESMLRVSFSIVIQLVVSFNYKSLILEQIYSMLDMSRYAIRKKIQKCTVLVLSNKISTTYNVQLQNSRITRNNEIFQL